MATAGHEKRQIAFFTDEDAFPALAKYFNPQEQRQLIEDDRVAWRNVTSILFALVTTGLTLGIIALTAIFLL